MAENMNDVKFVSVYKAPDEFMANTIKSLLKENGISTVVKSYQVAMYDSIGTVMKGNWGELLVNEGDREKAEDLISGFLGEPDV